MAAGTRSQGYVERSLTLAQRPWGPSEEELGRSRSAAPTLLLPHLLPGLPTNPTEMEECGPRVSQPPTCTEDLLGRQKSPCAHQR